MSLKDRKQKRQYMKDYWVTHPEKYADQKKSMTKFHRKQRQSLRVEIIQLLGSKCSNTDCPIPPEKMDIRCLQIDHINGNGNKERSQFSNYNQWLKFILPKIQVGSKDYQLLCAYCNWIKRYTEKS